MMKIRYLPLVLLAALALPNWASANILSAFNYDGNTVNHIKFNNWEVFLRDVTALAPDARPAGSFELFDPGGTSTGWWWKVPATGAAGDPTQLQPGDYGIQIMRATEVQWHMADGSQVRVWDRIGDPGEITAFLAQQLDDIQNGRFHWTAPTQDPFGILAGNESAKLYLDETTFFPNPILATPAAGQATGDQLMADVANIIGGAAQPGWFASFGFGMAIDTGFPADHTSMVGTVLGPNFVHATGGLNVLDVANPGWVFPGMSSIADPDQMVSTTLQANIHRGAVGAWDWISDDPWRFRVTPEPGSYAALAGMGLMGMVIALGRRRRQA